MGTEFVRFWVCMDGQLMLVPKVDKNDPLICVIEALRADETTKEHFANVKTTMCTLYKLRSPLAKDGNEKQWAKACLDARDDWIKMDEGDDIQELASDELLCQRYICLVIETVKDQNDRAIGDPRNYNNAPFQSPHTSSNLRAELVCFWVYMDGQLFLTPKVENVTLVALLRILAQDVCTKKYFIDVELRMCTLYKLRSPLAKAGKEKQWVKACLDARNDWIEVEMSDAVQDLASNELLCDHCICLVIETPKDQHDRAISELTNYNNALFQSPHTSSNRCAELVRFWVYMEGQLMFVPKVDKNDPLICVIEALLEGVVTKEHFADVNTTMCTLHKLRTPLAKDGDEKQWAKACLDARDDWIEVDNGDDIQDLASDELLCQRYICLVIETPKDEHDRAISELRNYNNALFQSLHIYLRSSASWTRQDVVDNLSDGVFLSWEQRNNASGQRVAPEEAIDKVEKSLDERRTFVHSTAHLEDIELARKYPSEFVRYFDERVQATCQSDTIQNFQEFVAFHYLLRFHQPNVGRVSSDPSSHFKANQLSSYFLVPPFFSCREENSKTVFKTELPWNFPIFVATQVERSRAYKYIPCSKFSVCAKDFQSPFFLCEVTSEDKDKDRYRMLLQGIAAIRALNVLKKPDGKIDPFVVAVYLRSDLTAERYIIMQTPSRSPPTSSRDGSSGLPKVSISQTDYDLKDPDGALKFMRVMFNLQDKIDELIEGLDVERQNALSSIAYYAQPLTSLTSERKTNKGTQGRTQRGGLDPISEENLPRGQRHPGHFTNDPEVMQRLDERGYEVSLHLHGFDHVSMVFDKYNHEKRAAIKFTTNRHEVKISRYLASISDSKNHTIRGLEVWHLRSGGFVIFTASGGSHIVDLLKPDVYMWSAARQLAEGVAFMHKHHVAHLDIKPANVLLHIDDGHLSIIDFSISEFVEPDTMIRGTKGTDGYMAPEVVVNNAHYDPIRADLWSTGKTLEDLTSRCSSSAERDFLVNISERLMAEDPSERPMMSDVLDWIDAFRSSPAGPGNETALPMIASETPA